MTLKTSKLTAVDLEDKGRENIPVPPERFQCRPEQAGSGKRAPMRKTTFTLAEAAEVLSCHKETLRRAIQAGELQAARLGREYRISRADLQVFWTAQGGGELFMPEQSAEPEPAAKTPEAKEPQTKTQRPSGPEQLTLPT